MAYKLSWSPAARDDLHDIVLFIATVGTALMPFHG